MEFERIRLISCLPVLTVADVSAVVPRLLLELQWLVTRIGNSTRFLLQSLNFTLQIG